jgi:aminoglycoside 3-N-acetyltransferase
MPITRREIVAGLRSLGLHEGDRYVMHSSLRSFGTVAGGSETVVEAMVESVSPGGTVIVPTMTFGAPFDRTASPSRCGRITETFRLHPDAVRSNHPTHSVAGIGPDAARLLEGHKNTLPNGPESPLGKLASEGGFVVLAGATHAGNTVIHIVQHLAGMPIFTKYREVEVRGDDGIVRVERVMIPGCSRGFVRLEPFIAARGAQRTARIGESEVRFMRASDIIEIGLEAVRRDPLILLCESEECAWCREAEGVLREWGT